MPGPFESLSTKDIQTLIHNVKSGIVKVVDMGNAAHEISGKGSCPAQGFHLKVGALETLEAEVFSRGLDPRHPAFGPDIMGAILDVQGAELNAG